MKKIIPSICMLLVTAVLMGTSTYAWFSMNREVKATGMQVSAVTSSNLIIKGTAITFTDGAEGEDSYTLPLGDGDSSFTALTPVSSATGKAFFTADKNAVENGDEALPDNAKFVAQNDAAAGGKTYWVKKEVFIGVKGVNNLGALSVNATVTYKDKQGQTSTTAQQAIYKALRFAIYYNTNEAVIFGGDTTAETQWNGATNADTANDSANYQSVTTKNAATPIAGLTSLTAKTSYQITIVVWLEGQDANCFANNTNAASVALDGISVDFTFTAAEA